MGQLEVYNINETIVSGLMLAIFITYFAEALESSTFESFKSYKYSANLASSKVCKTFLHIRLITSYFYKHYKMVKKYNNILTTFNVVTTPNKGPLLYKNSDNLLYRTKFHLCQNNTLIPVITYLSTFCAESCMVTASMFLVFVYALPNFIFQRILGNSYLKIYALFNWIPAAYYTIWGIIVYKQPDLLNHSLFYYIVIGFFVATYFKFSSSNPLIDSGKVFSISVSIFVLFTPLFYYIYSNVTQISSLISISLVVSSFISIFLLIIYCFNFHKNLELTTENLILIRVFVFCMLLNVFEAALIMPAIKAQFIWYSLGLEARSVIIAGCKKCFGLIKSTFFGGAVILLIVLLLTELGFFKTAYAVPVETVTSKSQVVDTNNIVVSASKLTLTKDSSVNTLLEELVTNQTSKPSAQSLTLRNVADTLVVVSTAATPLSSPTGQIHVGWTGLAVYIRGLGTSYKAIEDSICWSMPQIIRSSPVGMSGTPIRQAQFLMPLDPLTPVVHTNAVGQHYAQETYAKKIGCPGCNTDRVYWVNELAPTIDPNIKLATPVKNHPVCGWYERGTPHFVKVHVRKSLFSK